MTDTTPAADTPEVEAHGRRPLAPVEIEAHGAHIRVADVDAAETEAHGIRAGRDVPETEAHGIRFGRDVPETEAHGFRFGRDVPETEAHGRRPLGPADGVARIQLSFPADAEAQVIELRYLPATSPGGTPEVELHRRHIR